MAKRRSALNIFLDSSVLFSAVYSVSGGSAKLFTLKNVNLVASKLVLTEVERNVRQKLQSYHLARFFMLAELLTITESNLSASEIVLTKKVIAEKDAAILADFKKSKCSILIILDKKDFLQERVLKFVKPKRVLTTKMFFGQKWR